MKFLCNTEFFYSGVRLFTVGTVYDDITANVAERLITLDKKKPLGALSFFTPVDEEAINFVKNRKENDLPPADSTAAPKPPTKAELVKEAKDLGIQGADRMAVEELQQVIEAAKKASPPASGESKP